MWGQTMYNLALLVGKERVIDPKSQMKDLYQRLKVIGFGPDFVRQAVLPDWWEDSLASIPANRALAEISIARLLGLKVAELRKPDAALALPPVGNFRLKRHKLTTPEEVRPTVIVAERVATLAVESLKDLPPFVGCASAQDIRRKMLEEHQRVDLRSLLAFCWSRGIVVLYLAPHKMLKSKKFAGVAMFVGDRPVIILGSSNDGPPWLAFHLTHEMGHVFGGNVKAGDKPLVDSNLDQVDDDDQEAAADRFASEVLTGQPKLSFSPTYGLTAEKLVPAARTYGRQHAIDAGTVALFYGRSANRWGVAQNAIKHMGNDHGGQQIIADTVSEHLDLDNLPETTARFLSCLSLVDV